MTSAIDKGRGNVAFVCQRQYTQVLINERVLNNINSITSAYTKATKTVDKILSENTSFPKNKFNLEIFLTCTRLLNCIKVLTKQVLQLPQPSAQWSHCQKLLQLH